MKQKTVNFKSAVLPPTHIAAPSVLPIVKDDITTTKEDSPDVESMDVVQMSEAFSEQLIIDHDIDLLDAENPQFCSEYAKDIYQYMRDIEKNFHTPPVYMSKQTEINEKMRAILVDWLIQVHNRFSLLQETLYLTVSIIDRYLQSRPVPKAKLQLVGVTAMLIASKYEEMYAPEVRDFVYITANTYSSLDIQNMESEMLRALDYSFGNPLCLHFLRRNSRAGDVSFLI
jgi:cyclin B